MGELVKARHASGVYLLCATGKVGGRSRHYVGGSRDVAWRVKKHISGSSGASFVRAVIEQGYTLRLARVWYVPLDEVWALERQIKAWKKSWLLCPYCNQHMGRRGELLGKGGGNGKHDTFAGDSVGEEYPFLD